MIDVVILSFVAGIFTVAAPCILPLLPVIVGGTIAPSAAKAKPSWYRPLVITGSLAVSVVVFSLLLKATTALLGVPQAVWSSISGGLVVAFGVNLLFPKIWEKFTLKTGLYTASNKLLGASNRRSGLLKDILLGASLGPVFSSCSPTYALIIAVLLPQSFAAGLVYLCAYALGLAAMLLLIAVLGQSITQKLGWLSSPHGWFARALGIIFVAVGLAVLFGLDKQVQAFVLEQGWYSPVMKLEEWFR